MNNIGVNFYHKQINKYKQKVCGDSIAYKYIENENRIIAVLSDGLGSGVKANVLSKMASTMICRYVEDEKDLKRVAETVLKYLPECSERGIKYSTFSIIDIDSDGLARVIEYGNPFTLIFRNNRALKIDREIIEIESDTFDTNVYYSTHKIQPADIIVTFSDGVSQAGMGKDIYPGGWREKYIVEHLENFFKNSDNKYSAKDITNSIVSTAYFLDEYKNMDDISCMTLLFREPKKLIIATGAPQNYEDDEAMAKYFWENSYTKVICGGTTTKIMLKAIGVTEEEQIKDGYIPQSAKEKGVAVISEGVITLNNLLEALLENSGDKVVIEQLINLIQEHDEVIFLVGQKINQANVVGFDKIDIRQKIVDKIAKTLKEKFIKKTNIIYY